MLDETKVFLLMSALFVLCVVGVVGIVFAGCYFFNENPVITLSFILLAGSVFPFLPKLWGYAVKEFLEWQKARKDYKDIMRQIKL